MSEEPIAGVTSGAFGMRRRVVHMHIPKTAGTSLRFALTKAAGGTLRVFPSYGQDEVAAADPAGWDVFSGHFGFTVASRLQGDMVTVLRDPVDRFLSVYYFWRKLFSKGVDVSRKTRLAATYDLEDFTTLFDEPFLIAEFLNRISWQVACDSSSRARQEARLAARTDENILTDALHNLGQMALVGFQDRMGDFASNFEKQFGLDLPMKHYNATRERVDAAVVPAHIVKRIEQWVYLDVELYRKARERYLR